MAYQSVPVKLADCPLFEVLLGCRDVVTLGQVLDYLFTNPTAWEQLRLGVGEAPFEVRHCPTVGALLAKVVWVL